MSSPLNEDVRAFLAPAHPATMSTLRKNGQPVSVATWYLLDGDRVLVNLDHSRTRLDHLRRDGRVALTVLDKDDWYTHVSLQAHVVEIAEDEGLAGIDRISQHYTGRDYPVRDSQRWNVWLEVDRVHGWGKAKDAG